MTDKRNITWTTTIVSLPEDKSFDAVCNRLEKNNYETETEFYWDCSNLTEHVVNDARKFDYTKDMFDKLLSDENTPSKVKDMIIYGFGEISSYRKELKDEIVDVFSHHPNMLDNYFENNYCLYHEELTEINNASKEIIQKRESNQEYLAFVKEKAGISSADAQQEQETKTPNEASKSTPSSNGVDTSRNQGVDF